MGLQEFSAATVEEMESGVVRIRGKGLELNKTANLIFLLFFGSVDASISTSFK